MRFLIASSLLCCFGCTPITSDGGEELAQASPLTCAPRIGTHVGAAGAVRLSFFDDAALASIAATAAFSATGSTSQTLVNAGTSAPPRSLDVAPAAWTPGVWNVVTVDLPSGAYGPWEQRGAAVAPRSRVPVCVVRTDSAPALASLEFGRKQGGAVAIVLGLTEAVPTIGAWTISLDGGACTVLDANADVLPNPEFVCPHEGHTLRIAGPDASLTRLVQGTVTASAEGGALVIDVGTTPSADEWHWDAPAPTP